MNKYKYWTPERIKKEGAQYNIIFGERSNGKTTGVLIEGYKRFLQDGSQTGIIRRYDEDFVGANSAKTVYNSLIQDGNGENQIQKLSNGRYTGVSYWGGKYFLTRYNDKMGKEERTEDVIAYGFSLTACEHYKSASFPNIRTILFDEFMTRKFYLPDEFVLFGNVISTIIRTRDDVTIYMCANTVNKYGCPYFTEMGLNRIKEMKQGDIDVYKYGESDLLVAVEYSDGIGKKKPSDKYFSFSNPKLKMVTSGSWEMDIYPHCPVKYVPKDIIFTYFIQYEDITLQCEIISKDDITFTYIHRKTSELKDIENDIIYTTTYDARPNFKRRITAPCSKIEQKIASFFREERVYYQDNEVGEIVRNYLQWCRT